MRMRKKKGWNYCEGGNREKRGGKKCVSLALLFPLFLTLIIA